ncbi:MAG: hypothetical protein DWH82_04105 [Planctomycetota bacterium]|nr:MAG: hypothetical protein DWH82_04105 [Planctomycetota bacterium]
MGGDGVAEELEDRLALHLEGLCHDQDPLDEMEAFFTVAAEGDLPPQDQASQYPLASYKLGPLNGTKTDVTGSPSSSQSWDYDAVGNWDSFTTHSTTQTRSANKQNEITAVSGTTTYDSNGNLTTDENNNRFVYDAWYKVIQVKNSSNVVIVTYGQDALHRHVTDTVGSTVTDRFFSSDWQLLETKVGSNTVTRNVWSPVSALHATGRLVTSFHRIGSRPFGVPRSVAWIRVSSTGP